MEKKAERLWTKDYLYAVLVLFLCHMGPYLLLSVISIFAKQLTGSDTYAGMMASVFALSGLAARFLSAALLEKLPCKWVMVVSMAVMAAASFGYVFCGSYWMAFVLRGIQGLGYCLAVTSMSTYIVRIIPASKRLEGVGYSSLTASLAGVVGPSMAFAILGETLEGFSRLFLVVFAAALSSVLGLLFIRNLPVPGKSGEEERAHAEKAPWSRILLPLLILFLIDFALSPLSSQLSLYAIELGFGGIGAYFSISAVGLLLSRFTVAPVVRRLGNGVSILVFAVLLALCMAGVSRINALWQLYAMAFPIGYGQGALMPLMNTVLLDRLPDSKSSVANALFYAAGDLGFILGPTLWGALAGAAGYSAMFFCTAAVIGGSCLLALVQILLGRRRKGNGMQSV